MNIVFHKNKPKKMEEKKEASVAVIYAELKCRQQG
jgi:hypothetical protein